MSVRCRFHGGPLDGQLKTFEGREYPVGYAVRQTPGSQGLPILEGALEGIAVTEVEYRLRFISQMDLVGHYKLK